MDIWNLGIVISEGVNHMNKIIATGKWHRIDVVVECFMENGSPIIEVNDFFMESAQEEFEEHLKNPKYHGGMYIPPPDSLLAAHHVLQRQFFDSEPEITVEGDIGEIPPVIEGIVY